MLCHFNENSSYYFNVNRSCVKFELFLFLYLIHISNVIIDYVSIKSFNIFIFLSKICLISFSNWTLIYFNLNHETIKLFVNLFLYQFQIKWFSYFISQIKIIYSIKINFKSILKSFWKSISRSDMKLHWRLILHVDVVRTSLTWNATKKIQTLNYRRDRSKFE